MYIQLDGQILYYERVGEGENNMILLHGNGEDHSIFDELISSLMGGSGGDTYTIYAIDTRGHGLSATPHEYHYEDMAVDLINFTEALKISAPSVFGFSDGGVTALMAAAKRPGLFKKVIAAGANSSPKGLTLMATLEIKRQYKKDGSPLTEMMLKEPDLAPSLLSQISCPVLLLAGSKDMVKEKDSKKIAAGIKESELRILPGEDHGSYVVHSDRCADIIREFFG